MTTTVRPEAPVMLEAAPEPLAVERRRSTRTLRRTDIGALAGALVTAVSLAWVLFTVVAPFDGRLGFVVVTWLLFVGTYALLVGFDETAPTVRDRLAMVVVHSLALVVFGALAAVVVFTVNRGREALLHSNFFTQDLSATAGLDPLTQGGILHAVVGTLQQISLALALTIPLGLTCALFLSEVPGRFSRFVRTVSEAMTALPSIVAGLFIYATFILALGRGKSGLAASLALSVMMLPIIIRAADVVLRLVPGSLKEASLALGTSQWRTVWHVTLPTARSGLATAVILGAARGIGETSPVLLTAGYTATLNANPFEGDHTSLPLAAFALVAAPERAQIARGFGAAATLLLLVLLLFVLARLIGGRAPGQLTARQGRRRTAASARDAARMAGALSAAAAGTTGGPTSTTPDASDPDAGGSRP